MNCFWRIKVSALLFVLFFVVPANAEVTDVLTINGQPSYQWNKEYFNHVNPDAPKGGKVILSAMGGFDSMHAYIARGLVAAGMRMTVDTLGIAAPDQTTLEYYGLIAASFEVPEDKSSITFHLRPEARFHDNTPIRAEDVAYTFNTLIAKGAPSYTQYYASVQSVEVLSPLSVRFNFKEKNNTELPIILAQLPVFSKKYWKTRDFSKPTLTPPLGSGPYKVKDYAMGSYISYQRVKDYWAKDLPINRGRYNFDVIRYEYYRDKTVAREAFKAGEFDRFMENTAKAWETAYIGEAINKQHIKKEQIASNRPQGIYGLMFNTRKEIFKDKQIRQAITMAFDFEWINQRLFYNSYIRSASFFTNSDFAAVDLPDKGERDVLEPYRDRLPAAVFGPAVKPPKSDGKGDIRKIMKPFFTLFKDAGYQLKNGRMLDNKSKPFRFTVLLSSPSLSRVLMPFKKNLDRLGIQMDIQMVDPNQYVNRVRTFDYDMIFAKYPGSSSPGNELRYYFGSKAADTAGSRNYPGIKNPVVDELIEKIIEAPARSELVTRCRALDRVLRQEYYLIPGWHFPFIRIAYWNKFGRSTVPAPNGVDFYSWWIEPAKLETIRKGGTGYKN